MLKTKKLNGDPGRIRTGGLLLRRQSLYPAELLGPTLASYHFPIPAVRKSREVP